MDKYLYLQILMKWGIKMKERVLQYILDFGSISTWDAIKDLGCTRLSAYIYMLKKEGYDIKKETIKFTNRYGEKSYYVKYSLEDN